jgi:hypothetical protein
MRNINRNILSLALNYFENKALHPNAIYPPPEEAKMCDTIDGNALLFIIK